MKTIKNFVPAQDYSDFYISKTKMEYSTKNRNIKAKVRRKVFKRDGWACLKCGTKENLSIDHIKPKSLGGNNYQNNLQTLCRDCNSEKGDNVINYRKNHGKVFKKTTK